jgi:hypothetical protein
MKTQSILPFLGFATLAVARPVPEEAPIRRREVPQEHSHEQFLTTVRASLRIDNPDNIGDPVFGLLGNKVRIDRCPVSNPSLPDLTS